jgi:hypothetical protein
MKGRFSDIYAAEAAMDRADTAKHDADYWRQRAADNREQFLAAAMDRSALIGLLVQPGHQQIERAYWGKWLAFVRPLTNYFEVYETAEEAEAAVMAAAKRERMPK